MILSGIGAYASRRTSAKTRRGVGTFSISIRVQGKNKSYTLFGSPGVHEFPKW